ncbi:MAG: OmpH family outer membrane protein [Cyclobacteriaceae bacterium]|nr:OmpH family outer membrane protein [Cyclobacteriaceae bacterium]
MKKLVFVFAFALITAASMAQTTAALKVGYADVEYIFSKMPEAKQIQSDLEGLQAQLKKQYDNKYTEFQTKLKTYQDNINNPNIPDAVKQNSARELEQLQANLQKLQEDSQNDLQKRNATLLGPVQEKVGKAIEDVAKENGFSLILNNQINGLDVILFGDEKLDVSDMVLKKMGVNPVAETQTPANNTTTTPKKQP